MTISLDTYQPLIRKSFLPDLESSLWYVYTIKQQNQENVIFNFYEKIDLVSDFNQDKLTKLTMKSSESSFAELWDLEDDDYWSSYLND